MREWWDEEITERKKWNEKDEMKDNKNKSKGGTRMNKVTHTKEKRWLEMTKEGWDEEKKWDWTRKNEVTEMACKRRAERKIGINWRRDELKGLDEKEEWTAEEREGWEKGMMFRRGRVQRGSIICCKCGTCSDQCDDTNQREEKWSERARTHSSSSKHTTPEAHCD